MAKLTPTGKQHFVEKCQWCRGTGFIPQHVNGWYIDCHYQDGHETSGPYSEEEAIKLMSRKSWGCSKTLIGPDGCVYTFELEPHEQPEK